MAEPNKKIQELTDNLNDKDLLSTFSTIFKKRGLNFVKAVIVNLAHDPFMKLSMYGLKIVDEISSPNKKEQKSLVINKYDAPATGSCTAYIVKHNDDFHVILGGKKTYPGNQIMPGGYTNPNPSGHTKENGKYDNDSKDTAVREFNAEIKGVSITKDALVSIHKYEGFGDPIIDTKEKQTLKNLVSNYFYVYGGEVSNLPKISAHSDLETADWVNISKVVAKNEGPYINATANTPINKIHTVAIDKAIAEIRDKEISDICGLTRAQLYTKFSDLKSENEFGENSKDNHAKLLSKATALGPNALTAVLSRIDKKATHEK